MASPWLCNPREVPYFAREDPQVAIGNGIQLGLNLRDPRKHLECEETGTTDQL